MLMKPEVDISKSFHNQSDLFCSDDNSSIMDFLVHAINRMVNDKHFSRNDKVLLIPRAIRCIYFFILNFIYLINEDKCK